VLFIIAWAAIAFAIVRALVTVWGLNRRLAAATAVAVAGAFALGAISPFALPNRHSVVAEAPPPAPGLAVNAAHPVACPAGAIVGTKTSRGNLDVVAIGAAPPAAPAATIEVPAGSPIALSGWIVLASGPPAMICAIVDGRTSSAKIEYGTSRLDVAAALGQIADAPSGFTATLNLRPGMHSVVIGAVEPDGHTVDAMQTGPANVRVR